MKIKLSSWPTSKLFLFVSQNSRHRGDAEPLTCLNKEVSLIDFIFCAFPVLTFEYFVNYDVFNVFLPFFLVTYGISLLTEAPCLSLGCCVDLLPQVKVILTGRYEE